MHKALVRRVALSALVASLIAGVAFLEMDNANLSAAIAKQNAQPVKPPTEPIDVPPVPEEPEPSLIQQIKDKLAADGCNLNTDVSTKRKALGNCKILLIGDSLGNNLAYGMLGQLNKEPTFHSLMLPTSFFLC